MYKEIIQIQSFLVTEKKRLKEAPTVSQHHRLYAGHHQQWG